MLIASCQSVNNQLGYLGLLDFQIRLGLQHLAHLQAVLLLVALRSWRPDRWSARGIQQAKLDADSVGHLAHDSAQRVHLAHEMPLGDAANGGIARHLRDEIEVKRIQRSLQAHARRSHGGFATGMTRTYHHNIIGFSELLQWKATPQAA